MCSHAPILDADRICLEYNEFHKVERLGHLFTCASVQTFHIHMYVCVEIYVSIRVIPTIVSAFELEGYPKG